MPVILPDEHHDSWLSGEAGKEVLVPYPAGPNEGVANIARVILSSNRKLKPFPCLWHFFSQ
jgi:hypothetical protein